LSEHRNEPFLKTKIQWIKRYQNSRFSLLPLLRSFNPAEPVVKKICNPL
jgi:hypothetical protein